MVRNLGWETGSAFADLVYSHDRGLMVRCLGWETGSAFADLVYSHDTVLMVRRLGWETGAFDHFAAGANVRVPQV
jgi:hypothetical protein